MASDTSLDSSRITSASNAAPSALAPRRWLALAVVLVSGFMDLLDATIVNVAIPSIQENLNAQYVELEWVVAAYAISFAAVLITGGRLGDIYGRRRIFLLGVICFTLASTLCGVAPTPIALILARFLQGAAAALMVPQILAIIHVSFPPSERGKVFGLFGGIIGSAAVAGPIVGGLLVEWNVADLHWRPIFLLNIPVGIGAALAGRAFIQESRSENAQKLDLVGMGILVTAILMLVYPLAQGRTLGWPAWTFVLIGASFVLAAVFVTYERRRTRSVGSPLVVLDLFRVHAFDAGLVVWLLFNLALGGFFLVWTLYMQIGLSWTALHAGLTSIAFAFGAAPAAGLSVQVFTPRYGRRVMMAGALINALGFCAYFYHTHHYGPDISSLMMLLPLWIMGVGFGLIVAPIIDLVLSGVPRDDAGSASGVFNTVQQLGAAIGVALIGVLFFSQVASHAGRATNEVLPVLRHQLTAAHVAEAAQQPILTEFSHCVRDRSAATDPTAPQASCDRLNQAVGMAGPALARQVGADVMKSGKRANAKNFLFAFDVTLVAGAGILGLVFLGMFALPRKARVLKDGEMSALV